MVAINYNELAQEFYSARPVGGEVTAPSARFGEFSLTDGYTVGLELARLRQNEGYRPVGRKIGFTNKTIWPSMGLGTVIWAHVYDKTVQYAENNQGCLGLAGRHAPFIEPEIVFKLKAVSPAGASDPVALLETVEWVALGFEIVDSNFPDWSFKPADAIADFGLHAALIIGTPQPVGNWISLLRLSEQLRDFKITLEKGGQSLADGVGSNVLDSPALALGWLADVLRGQPEALPIAPGEVITTGSLTAALPVVAGEEWKARVEGIDLPPLTISFS